MQLKLTIEAGSEPIAGRIRFPEGTEQSFCGYMQLVGALERIRTSLAVTDPDDRPAPHPGRAVDADEK